MDLYSAIIAVITIYLLFLYFYANNIDYIILAIFFLIGLAYIKNDGFVIYAPSIVLGLITILIIREQLTSFIKNITNKRFIINLIIFIIFFFLPFLFIKKYYNL